MILTGAAWAEPEFVETLRAKAGAYVAVLERYRDASSMDEGCSEFGWLMVTTKGQLYTRRKVCAAYGLKGFMVHDTPVFIMQFMGGNGGGWGLYRYTMEHDELEYYDFSAGEDIRSYVHGDGVRSEMLFPIYDEVRGGRKGYRIETWQWDMNVQKPKKIYGKISLNTPWYDDWVMNIK